MKSYGVWDSSWNRDRIRDMLEDAAGIAREHRTSFCIYEDENGDIVLTAHDVVGHPRILICGVTTPVMNDNWKEIYDPEEIDLRLQEEFWNNKEYHNYTIDEMVPIVYDCLAKGIIEYGSLGFLGEGEAQLRGALKDAVRLSRRFSSPFIIGMSSRDIMVAPVSEKAEFSAPMACVVARSGFWSISDMHSDRIGDPEHALIPRGGTIRLGDWFSQMLMLYGCMGGGGKYYGSIGGGGYPFISSPIREYYYDYALGSVGDDRDACISRLESAFEDAVRWPRDRNSVSIIIDKAGHTLVKSERKPRSDLSDVKCLEVNPEEFLDGDVLLPEKITAAAMAAYDEFHRHADCKEA